MKHLAFIAHFEIRRWAGVAGEPDLAEFASKLISDHVPASRQSFLEQIAALIDKLEEVHFELASNSKELLAQQTAQILHYRSMGNSTSSQNVTLGSALLQ